MKYRITFDLDLPPTFDNFVTLPTMFDIQFCGVTQRPDTYKITVEPATGTESERMCADLKLNSSGANQV